MKIPTHTVKPRWRGSLTLHPSISPQLWLCTHGRCSLHQACCHATRHQRILQCVDSAVTMACYGMAVPLVCIKHFLLLLKHNGLSGAWQNMPAITSLGKWKQESSLRLPSTTEHAGGLPELQETLTQNIPTKKHNFITENKDFTFSYSHSLACKYQISVALDFMVFDK